MGRQREKRMGVGIRKNRSRCGVLCGHIRKSLATHMRILGCILRSTGSRFQNLYSMATDDQGRSIPSALLLFLSMLPFQGLDPWSSLCSSLCALLPNFLRRDLACIFFFFVHIATPSLTCRVLLLNLTSSTSSPDSACFKVTELAHPPAPVLFNWTTSPSPTIFFTLSILCKIH